MSDFFGIEKELNVGGFLKLNDGDEAEVTFLPGCTKREQVFANGKFEKADRNIHSEADIKTSYNFNLILWDGDAGERRRFGASTGTAKAIVEACKGVGDLQGVVFRIQRDGVGPKTRYLVKKLNKTPDKDVVERILEESSQDPHSDIPF